MDSIPDRTWHVAFMCCARCRQRIALRRTSRAALGFQILPAGLMSSGVLVFVQTFVLDLAFGLDACGCCKTTKYTLDSE